MKIEKINDNQIRCTLNKADLEDRNIKLSELAYGTGKTRELFQDMMQQANDDFGFEVNDIPLMVEAIPLSPESIVLVITKVEDKDEREKFLNKFLSKDFKEDLISRIDDIIGLDEFDELDMPEDSESEIESSNTKEDDSLLYSIYVFNNLGEIMEVANLLAPFYHGDSSIYKSPFNNKYYLSLCMEVQDEKQVSRVFSILTEHATKEPPTYVKELFYMEHFEEIIADKAIEKLGNIN